MPNESMNPKIDSWPRDFFHALVGLLPSLKLTLTLKIDHWTRRFLLETSIFRGEMLAVGRVSLVLFPKLMTSSSYTKLEAAERCRHVVESELQHQETQKNPYQNYTLENLAWMLNMMIRKRYFNRNMVVLGI